MYWPGSLPTTRLSRWTQLFDLLRRPRVDHSFQKRRAKRASIAIHWRYQTIDFFQSRSLRQSEGQTMAGRNSHHVVSNPKGGWGVKREGSGRAIRVFDHKEEAIRFARHISSREGGEVIIHSRDGRIRDKDTYGGEPFPPKDKVSRRK